MSKILDSLAAHLPATDHVTAAIARLLPARAGLPLPRSFTLVIVSDYEPERTKPLRILRGKAGSRWQKMECENGELFLRSKPLDSERTASF